MPQPKDSIIVTLGHDLLAKARAHCRRHKTPMSALARRLLASEVGEPELSERAVGRPKSPE